MIIGVLASLAVRAVTAISLSAPQVLMIPVGATNVALVVKVAVPPHAENARAVVEVDAGDVYHRSEWSLRGNQETWLVRWQITYRVGEGPFVLKGALLRQDGSARALTMLKGEVIQ